MCRQEINAAVDKTIRRDLSSEREPELSETSKNGKMKPRYSVGRYPCANDRARGKGKTKNSGPIKNDKTNPRRGGL